MIPQEAKRYAAIESKLYTLIQKEKFTNGFIKVLSLLTLALRGWRIYEALIFALGVDWERPGRLKGQGQRPTL